MKDSQKYLKKLFRQTLDVCSPEAAVEKVLSFCDKQLLVTDTVIDTDDRSIYILSVGKAAVPMYRSVKKVLGGRISDSLVIAPEIKKENTFRAGRILESSHPVPDRSSFRAGRKVVSFLEAVPDDGIILTLISGGTSSLICYPAEGIAISDFGATFKLLNRSGATIHEINTVRKHCSEVKGGGLLRYLSPSVTLIDLIISDVPGDDPSVIGSGPTTISPTTYRDALNILARYDLWEELPSSVQQHIHKGVKEESRKTVSVADPLKNHEAFIVGSARQFAQQAAKLAAKDGFECEVAGKPFNDTVETVASDIYKKIESQLERQSTEPILFLFYGESTVKVTGEGQGGRNQELALRIALKIEDLEGISCLCAGTDGVDGPTDAAGAIVNGHTIPLALEKGIDPQQYLQNNDSYHFHRQMDTLLKTGATGNNLMDVVWVMAEC